MAIYHLSAKIISRSAGRSSVAAAAYRSRGSLHDERQGLDFDYSEKKDLAYSEILLPKNVPAELKDRSVLWNEVEKRENRKDAQLAREIELALPLELTLEKQIELVEEFTQNNFVDQGMIADINIHSSEKNPHAHIMLTTREIDKNGFGFKNRNWNKKENVFEWREQWAIIQNQKLLEAGHEIQVDHRSFAERGIDLIPQKKLGIAAQFLPEGYLFLTEPTNLDRLSEYQKICRENGEKIIADPDNALKHVSHYHAIFKEKDILDFAFRHSADAEQFEEVRLKLENSSELIRLGTNDKGEELFTTRTMLDNENKMIESARALKNIESHKVDQKTITQTQANFTLNKEQATALRYIVEGGDVSILIGRAGTGKSYTLNSIREAYETTGYNVRGVALAGIAAEGLQNESGIESNTIHSQLLKWRAGEDLLTEKDILVVDEAGIVGTRQMQTITAEVQAKGAKVIFVGDNEQLPAIEAGGAFWGLMKRVGYYELNNIVRQKQDWQKEATVLFSGGKEQVGRGLQMYQDKDGIKFNSTLEAAKENMIKDWTNYRIQNPDKSAVLMAFTNKDVFDLNIRARKYLKATGKLGEEFQPVITEKGNREFTSGDRVIFLRNDKNLGVKNGSLGTVLKIDSEKPAPSMVVGLDTGPTVAIDLKQYRDIDYGYAATIHKTQGATLDRAFTLATKHFDKHAAYVSMSRHREDVTLYYSQDQFKYLEELKKVLGRENPKDLAIDFGQNKGMKIEVREKPPEARSQTIEGHYSRDITKAGKKYAVIASLESDKKWLVPFREEYDQFLFKRVEFDGQSMQLATSKTLSDPLNKDLPQLPQAGKLPKADLGKER
jgi:Ti-type conjugative transfer relaxase TraA